MIKKGKVHAWHFTGTYTFQKKLPFKDNRTIYNENLSSNTWWDKPINETSWAEYDSRIRVPSLKRKNAWKRFYRLYSSLKGKKVIHGSSSSAFYKGLNKSTIKLKKIK